MSVKTLVHPATGQVVKFGRKRPAEQVTSLKLKDYMLPELPPVPDCDYTSGAGEALGRIYLNDRLGSCVVAACGHLFGVLNEDADRTKAVFSDEEIIREYGVCGYNPDDPSSDNGCEVAAVLADILKNGFKGHHKEGGEKQHSHHRIAGWVSVDGSNKEEVRQAIFLFENLIIGMELPDQWIRPFPHMSGFQWDEAGPPDPENGHCIAGFATDNHGIRVSSWAMTGILTYAALSKYGSPKHNGEVYTVLSEELISKAQQRAPNGLNFSQLIADFKSLGGSISG